MSTFLKNNSTCITGKHPFGTDFERGVNNFPKFLFNRGVIFFSDVAAIFVIINH